MDQEVRQGVALDAPSYAGGRPMAEPDATPIAMVLGTLDAVLDHLHLEVQSLEERVAPVLGPETPEATATAVRHAIPSTQSAVGGLVAAAIDRVTNAAERIAAVRDRLEC